MKRLLIIGAVGVGIAVVLAAGVWNIAYAQGQTAGRAEIAASRSEFVQSRQGQAAGGGPGANSAGAGAAAGGGFGGAGGPGGGQGNRGGGGPPVAGTVEKIDGAKLTVAGDSG